MTIIFSPLRAGHCLVAPALKLVSRCYILDHSKYTLGYVWTYEYKGHASRMREILTNTCFPYVRV